MKLVEPIHTFFSHDLNETARFEKQSDNQGINMPDDLTRKGPEDPNTINTTQQWELKYWSDKFGISVEKLLAAIRAVGNRVDKIKAYLNK